MPAHAQAGNGGARPQARDVDQARLRAALNRYLAARARPAADPERGAARAALVQLLQDAGWEPPGPVQEALLQDRSTG